MKGQSEELSSQVQRWQQRHQDRAQALVQRDEDLVICKVELATLREKLHGVVEQVSTALHTV